MSNSSSPAEALQVGVERHERAVVVKLVGSAKMDLADDLRERLCDLVETSVGPLIIDLSELEFVSSIGLGAIIAAHLRCRHHDCEVKLVAPQQRILGILERTRLTKLFTIYDSVEAALAAN